MWVVRMQVFKHFSCYIFQKFSTILALQYEIRGENQTIFYLNFSKFKSALTIAYARPIFGRKNNSVKYLKRSKGTEKTNGS